MNDKPHTTDIAGRPIPDQDDVVYIDYDSLDADYKARQSGLYARGLPALKRLVEAAEGDTHQSQHCRRILLGLYNGKEWPLDLTRLRVIDRALQQAALSVIEWNSDPYEELHEYLPDGNRLFQRFWRMEQKNDDHGL